MAAIRGQEREREIDREREIQLLSVFSSPIPFSPFPPYAARGIHESIRNVNLIRELLENVAYFYWEIQRSLYPIASGRCRHGEHLFPRTSSQFALPRFIER